MNPNRKLLYTVVIIIVSAIGWYIYQASHFRVVSTDPSTKNVASVSPFFKVNFNRQLKGSGISVSSNPSIVAGFKVSGKTINITLISPLLTSQAYRIVVNNVSDIEGDVIAQKTFSFKPKYIESQNLSDEQKQALLQAQTPHPPSKTNIGFVGFDSLADYGLSTVQLSRLQQAFFNFDSKAKTVTIDTKSIATPPYDPNNPTTTLSVTFSVNIDGSAYNAKVTYSGLSIVRLVLNNIQGNQAYDSGNITD